MLWGGSPGYDERPAFQRASSPVTAVSWCFKDRDHDGQLEQVGMVAWLRNRSSNLVKSPALKAAFQYLIRRCTLLFIQDFWLGAVRVHFVCTLPGPEFRTYSVFMKWPCNWERAFPGQVLMVFVAGFNFLLSGV